MKLLYITTKISGAGGVQRVLLLKAAYLAENLGYTVTVLITNPVEEAILYPVSPAVTIASIQPDTSGRLPYFKSYKKLLNQSIEGINPDVVVMCDNGLKSFLLPFILYKKLPLVYERHVTKHINEQEMPGVFNYIKNKLVYGYMNFFAAHYTKVVALTQAGAKEWPANNTVIIPNPLWFSTNTTSILSNKRAIAVGRHTYQKGYDRMFAAWKEIVKLHPDWQLDIYGDDNPDYNVPRLALDNGVSNSVNFLKPTKDIIDAYLNASVYVMTSRHEGFGMVLLEAMACGVPCVAFNCPTGPEGIINDGVDGFLIKDGDNAALIDAITKLMEDDNLRAEMGAKAKENSEKFAIGPIMQQWDALFKSLL
ncbi:glycosyltransferase family 4 protein [Flavobacterium zepuense]|uniref:Glycosyltransferase family 4 protein n=1 Tax=Flavobacterium zepuense TaxID=2593302 RepID=A0A552UXL7_9FLAO|nr:glycosyltransferase family 4 protein [Flavobacterium zepuense]TRW22974.1 glycosyltransferase family 4 protein [Flavobacterium zepuense]